MTQLSKHHGLGNDFLVAVDPPRGLDGMEAIALCDRRRGIGADGLIVASPLSSDNSFWSMALWNSDGSRAEISGNGIRCMVQAICRRIGQYERRTFDIRTDAGLRTVEIWPDRRAGNSQARVLMGTPGPGPEPFEKWEVFGLQVERQETVDMGNPHLVVQLPDPEYVDLGSIGPEVESHYDAGINLHLIRVNSEDSLSLWVWERGAGITEACGSGASAAAWAAHKWGLVGEKVSVHQPGGTAVVEVGGPDDEVFLTGPTTFVADIEIDD